MDVEVIENEPPGPTSVFSDPAAESLQVAQFRAKGLIELRPPKDRVFAPKVLGTSARRLALPTMETTELQAKHEAE